MKIVTTICTRCGDVVLDRLSSLPRGAGEILKFYDEPIVFCPRCLEWFVNGMKPGKQGTPNGLGAPLGGLVADSPVLSR